MVNLLYINSQNYGGEFAKMCGLLRICELYNSEIYWNKVWNQKIVSQKRLATVQRNAYSFGTSLGLKLQKFPVFFACVPILARCTRSLCTKVMRVRRVTIRYHFIQSMLHCKFLLHENYGDLELRGPWSENLHYLMEKGCKNHKDTLCMLWINPVIFTDCRETPW